MSILDRPEFRILRHLTVEELRRIDPLTVAPMGMGGYCVWQQALDNDRLFAGVDERFPPKQSEQVNLDAFELMKWVDADELMTPKKRRELREARDAALAEKGATP